METVHSNNLDTPNSDLDSPEAEEFYDALANDSLLDDEDSDDDENVDDDGLPAKVRSLPLCMEEIFIKPSGIAFFPTIFYILSFFPIILFFCSGKISITKKRCMGYSRLFFEAKKRFLHDN